MCLISNLLIKPRNLDILTDSGLKAVGKLSLIPTTEVETRDGGQETLKTGEYCTVISLVIVSDFRATVLLALEIYYSLVRPNGVLPLCR